MQTFKGKNHPINFSSTRPKHVPLRPLSKITQKVGDSYTHNGSDNYEPIEEREFLVEYNKMLYDRELKKSFCWPLMGIIFVILIVLAVFRFWNNSNFNYINTFTLPPDSPGSLTTNKLSFFWWVTDISAITTILVIVSTALRCAVPTNEWYKLSQIGLGILFLIVEIIIMIVYILEAVSCNMSSLNVCNDDRFCCAFATLLTVLPPVSIIEYCPVLLAPCTPTVLPSDLGWNVVFTIGFILEILILITAIFVLVFAFCLGRKGYIISTNDQR